MRKRLLCPRHRAWIPFLVLFFICISCAPREFLSVSSPQTSYSVMLNFDPVVPDVLQQSISQEFQNFLLASAARPVRFEETDNRETADMVITVRLFEAVTPGQSAAGAVVSIIGLSVPFLMAASGAPFVVAFWYFPKSQSISEMSVNQGTQHQNSAHRLHGPGFLQPEEAQLAKHSRAYRAFFLRMQRHYEKDLRKAK